MVCDHKGVTCHWRKSHVGVLTRDTLGLSLPRLRKFNARMHLSETCQYWWGENYAFNIQNYTKTAHFGTATWRACSVWLFFSEGTLLQMYSSEIVNKNNVWENYN